MRSRAGSEDVWEMRRHPRPIRLALLSFFCAPREAEIIDSLVDLLIGVRACQSVGDQPAA